MKIKYYKSGHAKTEMIESKATYFLRSNAVILLPTGLMRTFPSGENSTFPFLYTVPSRLENYKHIKTMVCLCIEGLFQLLGVCCEYIGCRECRINADYSHIWGNPAVQSSSLFLVD